MLCFFLSFFLAVGWQVCSTSSLQHHGIRSAFCKPDFVDGSSKAAWKKRDYAAAAVIHDHCGSRESLQAECLEAMQENSSVVPPQKVCLLQLCPIRVCSSSCPLFDPPIAIFQSWKQHWHWCKIDIFPPYCNRWLALSSTSLGSMQKYFHHP